MREIDFFLFFAVVSVANQNSLAFNEHPTKVCECEIMQQNDEHDATISSNSGPCLPKAIETFIDLIKENWKKKNRKKKRNWWNEIRMQNCEFLRLEKVETM